MGFGCDPMPNVIGARGLWTESQCSAEFRDRMTLGSFVRIYRARFSYTRSLLRGCRFVAQCVSNGRVL